MEDLEGREKKNQKKIAKEWWEAMLCYAAMVLLLYVAVAMLTFQVRHPWMTDTERMIYTWRALTFQKVYRPNNR